MKKKDSGAAFLDFLDLWDMVILHRSIDEVLCN